MKLLTLLLLMPYFSFSQTETLDPDMIYDFVADGPEFPGGEEAMYKFIVDNMIYPESSFKRGEAGVVFVQVIVRADGSIDDVVIKKGVSRLLDKEALRIVKAMPTWIPGELNGSPVAVYYFVPVKFVIDTN